MDNINTSYMIQVKNCPLENNFTNKSSAGGIVLDIDVSKNNKQNVTHADIKKYQQLNERDRRSKAKDDPMMPYSHVSEEQKPVKVVMFLHYLKHLGRPPPPGLNYTPETRNGFVYLVYSIVFAMIVCTIGFNCLVIFEPHVNGVFVRFYLYFTIPSFVILIFMCIVMIISKMERKPPWSNICLVVAILCASFITSSMSAKFSTFTVLYALAAIETVVFLCILLTFSSFDFTQHLLYAITTTIAFLSIMAVIGISMLIEAFYMKPVSASFLVLCTIFYSILMTLELQLILGDKSVKLTENEYAYGAYILFTCIIDVFLKMMRSIGLF